MTQEKRLADLIGEAERAMWGKTFHGIQGKREFIADCLLENGVIVPPCKVGDTVFCLINECNELDSCSNHICMSEVENFSFEKRGNDQLLLVHLNFWNTDINPRTAVEFVDVVFGKTVFLTLEEAEAALKDRCQK